MNNIRCSICQSVFSFDNVPKILKNCSHSVCLSCLKIQKNCLIDNKPVDLYKYGLKNFLTNTQILQQLRIGSNKKKVIDKEQQNKTSLKRNLQIQNCLLHSKPADVICFQEGQTICSTCALFGQHKGHKVLSYDQVLKNISQIAEDALAVYDGLKLKQQSLSKEVINQYIQNGFKQKRNQQAKNIRQLFQKTIQKLRKIEKVAVSNLDFIISKRIKVLKQTFNSEQINQKIKQWYIQVQNLGNVTQDFYNYKSIKKAIKYLDLNSEESFLCQKGEYLSIEISALESIIRNKIDQEIELVTCIFNDKILDSIDQICKFDQKFKVLIKESQQKKNKMFQGLKIVQTEHQIKLNQQKNTIVQQLQKSNEDILLDTQAKDFQSNNQFKCNEQSILSVKRSYLGFEQQTHPTSSLQNSIICQISSLNISSFENLDNFQSNCFNQGSKSLKITSRNGSKDKEYKKSHKKIIKNQNDIDKNKIKINPFHHMEPIENQALKNVSENYQIKKKKKIQIPEKYKNLWEDIKNNKLDQVDLTGAQLGDSIITSFVESIAKSNKIKQLKLIRNKLTDQIMHELISSIRNCNVTNINLSQNSFTEKCLQTIEHYDLGNLKTITLSLNKINGRKVKDRLQALRQRGIIVSI